MPNLAPLNFYLPVTIVWTLAKMLYLGWYFIVKRDEKRVEQLLAVWLSEK